MPRMLVLLAVILLLPMPAPAQDLSAGDRDAIRQVIESQLDAFRRDDAGEAFSYASPMIQEKFGNPTNFMRMVREGYAPVYRPRAVEFRDLTSLRGRPAQEVLFVGPDGRAVLARYFMERQPSGRWRIDGVVLTMAPDRVV